MADIKQILKETIEKAKQAKAEEDSVRQKKNDEDRNKILEGVGGDLTKGLQPVLQQLAENSRMSEEQLKKVFSEAIQVSMPEMDTESLGNTVREAIYDAISGIQFPEPKVNVSIPETKFPEFKFPETKFPEYMDVGLGNIKPKNALPVRLVDTDGKPFVFSFPSGSGGGKSDFFTVKGIQQTVGMVAINPDGSPAGAGSVASSVSVSDIFNTVGADVVNPDGRIKVELPTGASGLTDTELRATAVPVSQVSGALWSTTVYDVFQTTVTSNVINPDNRVKVELPTGSSGLTDTELRATAVPVSQLSGASWSTSSSIVGVSDIFSTTSTSNVVNPDNRVKVELPATTITAVTSITNSIAATIVDSTGIAYSGSNPVPVGGTLTDITNTIEVMQVSGSSWSVAATIVGSTATTAIVGEIASDVADTESNPVKTGGVARTANPTAVANGDRVSSTYDDLGRQVMRPLQVRDLILTAYTSISNGTETTLRAAVAGASLDMIQLVLGNTSDAAVTVDVRAVTAGNISLSVVVPPYGTAGYSGSVPIPQSEQGNNWTIDMPDITGTTVYAGALFSQEV